MVNKATAAVLTAFLAGVALGALLPLAAPEAAERVYRLLLESVARRIGPLKPGLQLAFKIFVNNSMTTLLAIALGVLLIPPLLLSFLNGFTTALAAAVTCAGGALPAAVIAALAPHGVIEIPAFLYGLTLGVKLGVELWRRVLGRESKLRELLRSLPLRVMLLLALLLIAAFVEAFITPRLSLIHI